MIRVQQVSSASDFTHFLKLPYHLNRENGAWVPPLYLLQKEILSSERNPFWRRNTHQFFLASRGKEIVGRVAAIVPKDHNDFFKRRDGFFGFLEGTNEEEVFSELLNAAEKYLAAEKCERVIGPMSPTIHHELGILIDGFDQPSYFMLAQNPGYYDELISLQNYRTLRDYYSYRLRVNGFQEVAQVSRWTANGKLQIRHPVMSDFQKELGNFFDIYNNAFQNHRGFAPISWEDFYHLAKDLKFILDPELVLIAEVANEPVGFLLALPNLNELLAKIRNGRLFPFGLFYLFFKKRSIKSLRVITVAIKQKYQPLGIGAALYQAIARKAQEKGFIEAELSWVAEDNVGMNKIARRVGARRNKTYRLYEKELTGITT